MNDLLSNVIGRDMRIVSMRIADTGTYDDQWARPYESVIGMDFKGVIDNLHEQGVATGRNITPGMFADIASEIVRPQAQPEGNTPIVVPNGWGSNRFRWTMLVCIRTDFGEQFEMVTGFTDYRGVNYNNNLDPNMVFTITNTIMLKETMRPTPSGMRTMFSVNEATHVLAHNESSGIGGGNQKFRIRPADVFSSMDMSHFAEDLFESGGMDTRTLVTQEAVKAHRRAEIPTNYVADIMQSYKNAIAADKYGQDAHFVLETATDNLREASVARDPFIAAVANMRGHVGTNWFTWRELCQLDPNVSNSEVTIVTIMGSPRQYVNEGMAARGRGVDWATSTIHTQIATMLAQAVPAVMMSLGFASLRFVATNRTINQQFHVQVLGYKDFASSLSTASLDMTEQLMVFQNRIGQEVMVNASHGGQLDMELEMEVNIIGESYIRLSAGMDPVQYEYVVPSFMDAAFTPLMTSNINRTTEIAHDMQMLLDNSVASKSHEPGYLQDQNGQPLNRSLGIGSGSNLANNGFGGAAPADLI